MPNYHKWLVGGVYGPETYHIIKRLRFLRDENADGTEDVALNLHTLARSRLIFRPKICMLAVVASPHMPQFLFGDEEDLLNEKTRMIRTNLRSIMAVLPKNMLRLLKMKLREKL